MQEIKDYLKENLIDEKGFPTYKTKKAAIIASRLNSCLTCCGKDMFLLGQKAFSWTSTK